MYDKLNMYDKWFTLKYSIFTTYTLFSLSSA